MYKFMAIVNPMYWEMIADVVTFLAVYVIII